MAGLSNIPVSGTVLHQKDTDTTERIIFPVTAYECIVSAPKITNKRDDHPRAPFIFLTTGSETMTEEQITELLNIDMNGGN